MCATILLNLYICLISDNFIWWFHGCHYRFWGMDNFRSVIWLCNTLAKLCQGRPKSKDCGGSLTSAILPNMNIQGQIVSMLEPKNRKGGQCVLTRCVKVKVTYAIYSVRAFRAVWLHYSAAVGLVSEILPFENFPLNVCQCHKSRSRSSTVIPMQRLY